MELIIIEDSLAYAAYIKVEEFSIDRRFLRHIVLFN